MKVYTIIYSALITVICVLLAILQYYYSHWKQLTAIRDPDPFFQDLILNIDEINYHTHNRRLSEDRNLLRWQNSDDLLYFKALTYNDQHDILEQIDEKRDLLRSQLNTTIKKDAFYLHIHHTMAIEGSTLSAKEMQYILETGNTIEGKSILEHNELIGLEMALHYVKILSENVYVQMGDILKLHKRVMGYVYPLTSGACRQTDLMDGFVDWLNTADTMHPVTLAALAHHKLNQIHPFDEGNGLISRLIMNLILLKSGYPPIIIYKEDQYKYYNYLKLSDVRPFIRFIVDCTDRSLNMYLGLNRNLINVIGPNNNNTISTFNSRTSNGSSMDEINYCS